MDEINALESGFSFIQDTYNNVNKWISKLKHKHGIVNKVYKLLGNKQPEVVNTLDIFNFQNKLLLCEINHMHVKLRLVCNRIYCQYYKLFLNIQDFVVKTVDNVGNPNTPNTQSIPSTPLSTKFPEYDDMKPEIEYDFENIHLIHVAICELLRDLFNYIYKKNMQYVNYSSINKTGLHLDTFVDTFKYNIQMVVDNYCLYMRHMVFYNELNAKHLLIILDNLKTYNAFISTEISFPQLKQIMGSEVECDDGYETDEEEPVVVDAPVVETPVVVDAPVVEAPVIETPVVEVPVIEAPVDAPLVKAPVVDEAHVDAPVEAQVEAHVVDEAPVDASVEAHVEAPAEALIVSGIVSEIVRQIESEST